MVMFGNVGNKTPTFIEERILKIKPELVVELGFGQYTGLIGEWTEANGAKLYSYHQLPESVDKTKRMCYDLRSVDVVFAPVSLRTRSYSVENIPYGIDVAIIDGPSKNIGKQESLPLLWESLAKNSEVLLTEATNAHEQACLKRWYQEFDVDIKVNKDADVALITINK